MTDSRAHPRDIRDGEVAIDLPPADDAGLIFIGKIHTPWTEREAAPRNSMQSDAECTVELDQRYAPGLEGLETAEHLILLYWLNHSRRDLIVQRPRHLGDPRGVFTLRSPVRPNPIGLSVVDLIGIDGNTLTIRHIDCLDGTPLIDIKPYFARTDAKPGSNFER
jgi:tRNA-Thr(GGU) m(6)t(6)A37 methyltransferase TsaA